MGAIYLVRHGQASFGAADYDQLSELGGRQATLLGEALRTRVPAPAAVWCGRMRRHRQTAEACLAGLGASVPIGVDGGWDEYDHDRLVAVYEPRYRDRAALAADLAASDDPARTFQRLFAAAVARWVSGAHDGDYDERWSEFRARVAAALATVARGLGKAETALVFTSGGPIATACGTLLHVPEAAQLALGWTLANAGLSKLLCRGDSIHLSTLNDHAHFEGAADRRLITYR
jgi:broad specificity phosphatase PhoE